MIGTIHVPSIQQKHTCTTSVHEHMHDTCTCKHAQLACMHDLCACTTSMHACIALLTYISRASWSPKDHGLRIIRESSYVLKNCLRQSEFIISLTSLSSSSQPILLSLYHSLLLLVEDPSGHHPTHAKIRRRTARQRYSLIPDSLNRDSSSAFSVAQALNTYGRH
jgi:hypothetical protein